MKAGIAPSQIQATLQLGKAGATDEWVEELRQQVEKHKVVKVRLLRSAVPESGMKAFTEELARRSGTRLVLVRGHVAVFGKPA